MPRVIATEADAPIELGDLVEALESGGFDPDDEDSLIDYSEALRGLSNNRRFLGDLVIEELKQGCMRQRTGSQYNPQAIVLHGSSRRFVLRANFWPAAHDNVVVNSGTSPFFYGLPHDHNFSFLTVGYHGPGYWSDYYEYDYADTIGVPGEPVDLRFVERTRLDPGKVMLYRKHRDVHSQLPPDALSISLNILALSAASEFCDQYRFDIQRGEVGRILNPSSLESLVMLAAHLGGDNGRDLVDDFAASHPSERIRFAAVRAQAATADGVDGRLSVYEAAARRGGALVAGLAAHEARQIQATRGWIEREPVRCSALAIPQL